MLIDLLIKAILVILLFVLFNMAARLFDMTQMSIYVPIIAWLVLVAIKFSGKH